MNQDTKNMIGVLAYATVGEPLLDMVAQKIGLNTSDELVKGAAGYALDHYGSGVVKATGRIAWILALNSFIRSNVGTLNLFGTSTGTNSTNDGW